MTAMKRFSVRLLAGLLLAAAAAATLSIPEAWGDVPYSTFAKDNFGRTVATQPAYRPTRALAADLYTGSGETLKHSPLKGAQDVFVDGKDEIYIADTGNDRIVHLNAQGELLRIIQPEKDGFRQPNGLFVAEDGTIYVADTGNQRIVRLHADGTVAASFGKPESRLLPEGFVFDPVSLVADRRGFLYVATRGGYQGLLQLNPDGKFFGFYGTNRTAVSWLDTIRYAFYTDEQLRRQERRLPDTIRKAAIDAAGFIYTASVGSAQEQLKKLNIGGDNRWAGKSFGAAAPEAGSAESAPDPVMVDLTVSPDGEVTAIDRARRMISQYDAQGKLMFYWTGPVVSGTHQLGLLQSPAAIASDSGGNLYVLDDQTNMLTVLEPTEFGRLVHRAFALLRDGRYDESEDRLREIVRLNAHFAPAYEGLSQIAYHREHYGEAMELARLAGNAAQYSDAKWQVRLGWMQRHFSEAVYVFAAACVLVPLGGRLKRRRLPAEAPGRQPMWLTRIGHVRVILRHPIEGFSQLRYLQKGSYPAAIALLAAAAACLLLKSRYTSFAFHPVETASLDAMSTLVPFLLVWFGWVVCHYLIGSITRGEGRFKDVFIGSAYALAPVVLIGLPTIALSHALTLGESSIYHFLDAVMYVWCALLFIWMAQGVHNYSAPESLAAIGYTLLAMLALGLLLFTLSGLASEFVRFVYAVYQEVSM